MVGAGVEGLAGGCGRCGTCWPSLGVLGGTGGRRVVCIWITRLYSDKSGLN